METKTCNRCNINKLIIEFSPTSPHKGKVYYRGECKECNRANQKKPAAKLAQKKYKSSNKAKETRRKLRANPEVKSRENRQERERYHGNEEYKQKRINKSVRIITENLEKDPVFRGIWYLKNALRDWTKSNGERKDSEIGNYVGCSKEEFRIHIEKQFTSEMNWGNHADYWEYDHKIPISSAKSMEEAYKLTHYSNIQPMEKTKNREKSDKRSKEYDNE